MIFDFLEAPRDPVFARNLIISTPNRKNVISRKSKTEIQRMRVFGFLETADRENAHTLYFRFCISRNHGFAIWSVNNKVSCENWRPRHLRKLQNHTLFLWKNVSDRRAGLISASHFARTHIISLEMI